MLKTIAAIAPSVSRRASAAGWQRAAVRVNHTPLVARCFSDSNGPAWDVISKTDLIKAMNSGDVQLIDVREEDEIAVTGPYETSAKGSAVDFPGEVVASALTLPLSALQLGALHMQDKVFEEAFGFKKPSMEQHLAFACRSGVRSNKACNIALGAGYEKVYNYKGSALEWFGDKAK